MHLNTQLAILLKKLKSHDLEDTERSAIALELLTLGFIDSAHRAFDDYESEGTERMRRFLADIDAGEEVLDQIEPPEGGAIVEGESYGETRASGVLLVKRENAKRLLIVFSGNTKQLAIPQPVIDDQETSMLCVRDANRCFALMGLPRLGQSYQSVLDSFRRCAEVLGLDKVYVIGTSSGGYAALRYAFDLRAEGVIGFSAPTSLNIADDPGATTQKYPQLARLYARSKEIGFDMVPHYEEADVRPSVILVYCPGHERDKIFTERMMHVPGVELVSTPDEVGHTTFPWYNEQGLMQGVLERLYALTPTVKRAAA
jgi:hypothetical protein